VIFDFIWVLILKVTALWDAMPYSLFYSHRRFRVISTMRKATNSTETLQNSTTLSFVTTKDTFFFAFNRRLGRSIFVPTQ